MQVVLITVGLHVGALVIFGSITVYKFIKPPEPEFEPPPPLESIEPQKLEYKVKSKDLQKNSARPRQQRISVKAISQINTPDVDVALPEFSPEVAVGAGTGVGSGLGQGLGSGGLGFGQSAVNFFGLESTGERIIIVFDISTSVVNKVKAEGYSITRIRDKTIEIIESLNPGTMFGIIQHSRNYDVFKDELVPALPENKEEAIQWMKSEFETSGSSRPGWVRGTPNGIQSVIKAAFEMEPDLVFLLSDASYQRTGEVNRNENVPWNELQQEVKALQRELPRPASINFIGFGVHPDNAREMKGFIRLNDGEYREFEPDDT
jgi:hypothetical protein